MGYALVGLGNTAPQGGTAGSFSSIAGNGLPGNFPSTLGENFLQIFAPFALQISGLTAAQGPLTGPFTLQLRRSGVNVGNVITDTAPTDTTHVDAYTIGQAMILQWGSGSTGSVQRLQALIQATDRQHGAIYASTHSSGGANLAAGGTYYPRTCASTPGGQTTEAPSQAQAGCAGVLNGMFIQVPTNTTTAPTTITSRINGANGNQTLTIAAGTTVNTRVSPNTGATDAVNLGDLFCAQAVVGAGSGSILVSNIGFGFTPNVGNQNDLYVLFSGSWPAGTTWATPYGQSSSLSSAAAANVALGFSGAITRFSLNVQTNTLTAAGNVNASVNGANVLPGGITLTIGVTGWFVSGGGQTAFGPTDRVCWAINGGSGGGLVFGVGSMTISSPANYTATLGEVGAATDAPTSSLRATVALAETGSATDAPTSSITTSVSLAESGAAADTPTSRMTANLSLSELGAAADTTTASAIHATVSLVETGAAADTTSSQLNVPVSLVEAGAAVDIPNAHSVMSSSIAEVGAAADTPTSSLHTAASIVETGAGATDTLTPVAHYNAQLAEAGAALDALTSTLSGTAYSKALSGGALRIDFFLLVASSPPIRAWSGVSEYFYAGDNIDPGGPYLGLGRLQGVPELNQLLNGAAQRVEFTLSGVDEEVMSLADANAASVRNVNAYLGLAIWDQDFNLVGNRLLWLWMGISDAPKVALATEADSGPVRRVSLSCATLLSSRRRARYAYWTDVEHQVDQPGDTFFSQVALYNSMTQVVWPT